MFVGWFKIEGHSNPTHRRVFERPIRLLKEKQRLAKGVLKPEKKDRYQYCFEQKIKKTVTSVILVLLCTTCLSLFIENSNKIESSVSNHMERLQIEVTGSGEFISPSEKFRREGEEHFKLENYNLAYSSFKEAYKWGTTNKEVYFGLFETTKKLCEEEQSYCEEVIEWKKVIDRLK